LVIFLVTVLLAVSQEGFGSTELVASKITVYSEICETWNNNFGYLDRMTYIFINVRHRAYRKESPDFKHLRHRYESRCYGNVASSVLVNSKVKLPKVVKASQQYLKDNSSDSLSTRPPECLPCISGIILLYLVVWNFSQCNCFVPVSVLTKY
jgi:hypothetical protein